MSLFHSRSFQNSETPWDSRSFRILSSSMPRLHLPSLTKFRLLIEQTSLPPPCLCLCCSFCPQRFSNLSPSGDLSVLGFYSQWQKPTKQLEFVAPSCLTAPPWYCDYVSMCLPHPHPSLTRLSDGQGHVLLDRVVRKKGHGLGVPQTWAWSTFGAYQLCGLKQLP